MTGPSVAVVVLDTLRRDTFNWYFEWVPGLRFENAYSTSHWTVPAHASLLTGKYASEVGVHAKSCTFDCPETSLTEVLHADGYTTRLWTANMQICEWDGWGRGFDQVLGEHDLHPLADRSVDWSAFRAETETTGPRRYLDAIQYALVDDGAVLPSVRYGLEIARLDGTDVGARRIRRRLGRTDFGDEEFLLINLTEAHTPHYPPTPFRTVDERVDFKIGDAFSNTIDQPDRNRRAYDDSCAYLSSAYRGVFDVLQHEFDYVVTLSDHGELLGEQGLWNHGYGLYPELTRVPLVISGEGCPDETRHDVASLVDVPQTIAGVVGIEFDSHGRDLLGDAEPKDRLVEYHGFLPWHRDQFDDRGVTELYDRYDGSLDAIVTVDGEYAYETHGNGLTTRHGGAATDQEDRLDELRSSRSIREIDPGSTDITDDVRARLEELGYA